eukprot:1225544-Rhodomonas_salina.1
MNAKSFPAMRGLLGRPEGMQGASIFRDQGWKVRRRDTDCGQRNCCRLWSSGLCRKLGDCTRGVRELHGSNEGSFRTHARKAIEGQGDSVPEHTNAVRVVCTWYKGSVDVIWIERHPGTKLVWTKGAYEIPVHNNLLGTTLLNFVWTHLVKMALLNCTPGTARFTTFGCVRIPLRLSDNSSRPRNR